MSAQGAEHTVFTAYMNKCVLNPVGSGDYYYVESGWQRKYVTAE